MGIFTEPLIFPYSLISVIQAGADGCLDQDFRIGRMGILRDRGQVESCRNYGREVSLGLTRRKCQENGKLTDGPRFPLSRE